MKDLTDIQLRGLRRHLDTHESADGRLFFVSYVTDKWGEDIGCWYLWNEETQERNAVDTEEVPEDLLERAR